jgi:FkbM family methyltransferase
MQLLVTPGATVLDVGANVGRFTVALAQIAGSTGRVFAFEPVPDTYQLLRENLALNRCCEVIAVQAAMSDEIAPVTMNLFEPPYSSWNTQGRPSMPTPNGTRIEPTKSILVEGITIDAFCAAREIDHVDFLKVDVEGFEAVVFRGSTRMLRERRIDAICFEISRDPLKGAGFTAKDIFNSLECQGYSIYRFDGERLRFTGPVHDSDVYWDNYYASYRSLLSEEFLDSTP